jgi:20S proteasome subunit alpha 1
LCLRLRVPPPRRDSTPTLSRVCISAVCVPIVLQATAAGSKEQDAINALEKKVKAGGALDADETVRMAIATMQSVLTSDFKASEIEIAVVRKGERVHLLSEAEIDAHLTVLAERD